MLGVLLCVLPLVQTGDIRPPDNGYGRATQQTGQWERFGGDLIWGFRNMYQPCVVERPGEEYPFKMWFFGWAAEDANPNVSGCDAIYHARSKDLLKWEIYSGDQGWDTEMRADRWRAVLSASDRYYDSWHNGDPSVVFKDGTYYMAYSATSNPGRKKGASHLDGLLLCIMGATSEDGIHWTKTEEPLLIESKEAQEASTDDTLVCDFHRPSLMWDEGKWKLWFDYWCPPTGVCLGFAENTGGFAAKGGFQIKHDPKKPLIINWPNPSVIKNGNQYHAFADPSGFPPKVTSTQEGKNWSTRALCEAVSDDGLHWRIAGYIAPDADAAACHVPQTLVSRGKDGLWLYVFYATQRGGNSVYDYRYDRIRAIRRKPDY